VITLVPVPPDQKARVAHLTVAPGQEDFVRNGAYAASETDAAVDLYAVEQDGAVVGMFKLDRAYADAPRHDFAQAGDLGLRGVLVDAAWQGKGIGRALLAALPDLVRRRYPQARRLVLTVNCRNHVARSAYLAAGWLQDDRLYLAGDAGPQNILWLPLAAD
jgi:GNAT superfamily N-acetyltransferase